MSSFAPLAVEHDDAYVLGGPLHVAITIRAARPGTSFAWLPAVTPYSTHGAIGCTLRRPDGSVALHHDPAPLSPELIDLHSFELTGNAERRMLFDLSDLTGGAPAGRYHLTVRYHALLERPESAPVEIALREPTPDEAASLDAARAELGGRGTWGEWTYVRTPLAPLDLLPAAVLRNDPLRFNRVDRRLALDPTPPGDRELEAVAALDGVYVPDAAALNAEILLRRGDREAYARQAAFVRERFPGLRWWMDALDA